MMIRVRGSKELSKVLAIRRENQKTLKRVWLVKRKMAVRQGRSKELREV